MSLNWSLIFSLLVWPSKSHSYCIWFDFPADTECSWMASQHPFFPWCISASGTKQQQTRSVWISPQDVQLPGAPERFHLLSSPHHSRTPTGDPWTPHPEPPDPTGWISLHSPHWYRPLHSRFSKLLRRLPFSFGPFVLC